MIQVFSFQNSNSRNKKGTFVSASYVSSLLLYINLINLYIQIYQILELKLKNLILIRKAIYFEQWNFRFDMTCAGLKLMNPCPSLSTQTAITK